MSNQSRASIGVDAIALSVPAAYIDLHDLAVARGVPPEKMRAGLGVERMAVAGPEEDTAALAINAARRLFRLSGASPGSVGLLVTGTETAVDHSKPVASYVHGHLGLPSECRVYETKHACYGGTAGLFTAVDWIASGSARGRSALVVCADIARYSIGSAGEPTQGAGAVALLIKEEPGLVEIEVGRTGTYTKDVHDFFRPLDHKDAVVDGQLSVECYLDALAGAYGAWRAVEGGGEPLSRTCYHVPYGKMARKAHRRRLTLDGVPEAEHDARFAVEVEPSLRIPAQVGNVYTGSLYMALASLLSAQAEELAGRRIGLFSYGSGCMAEMFAGRVRASAPEVVRRLDIEGPLRGRRRLSMGEYEALRHAAEADARRVGAGGAAAGEDGLDRRAVFLGVDAMERRIYGNA